MIARERLEQLIEKGAEIWHLCGRKDIRKTNARDIPTHYRLNNFKDWELYKEYYFETKEDAEEYAEFGNITRTEKLELPSWEDVKKDSETLKYGTYTIAEYKHLFSLNLKILKYFPTQIVLFTDTEKYGWNLSRENYNEARRLCVKLFKGEDV